MNSQTIRSIILKREQTNDEWEHGVEQCWEELASAISSDYDAARTFLLEDCTAEEASWVSEVFEEIVQKTQSQEFIDLLRASIERFPEEDKLHRMSEHLDMAVKSCFVG